MIILERHVIPNNGILFSHGEDYILFTPGYYKDNFPLQKWLLRSLGYRPFQDEDKFFDSEKDVLNYLGNMLGDSVVLEEKPHE